MEPVGAALLVGAGTFGLGFSGGDGSSVSVELYKDGPSGAEGPFLFAVDARSLEPHGGAAGPLSPGWAILAFDEALKPYSFGAAAVDPAATLRAAMAGVVDAAGAVGAAGAFGAASLAEALWAAVEAELFGYAFDPAFTAALEAFRGGAEWRRFARLNDLYRGIARAIAPFGVVPGSWTGRLRGEAAPRNGAFGRLVERLATRPIGAAAAAVAAKAEPGSLFRVPLPDTLL